MHKSDEWIINGSAMDFPSLSAWRLLIAAWDRFRAMLTSWSLSSNCESSGLLNDAEHDHLKAAEICGQLEAGNESLCALAISGCGTRDLIFYTKDQAKAQQRIEAVQSAVAIYPF